MVVIKTGNHGAARHKVGHGGDQDRQTHGAGIVVIEAGKDIAGRHRVPAWCWLRQADER